jgi:TonB family protein
MAGLTTAERSLRVAYIWNGTIQSEETFRTPRAVTLGPSKLDTFPLPDGVTAADSIIVLEPARGHAGFAVRLSPEMNGSVWVNGERRDLRSLGQPGSSIPLGPNDYGVVTLGTVAVFFQHVRGVRTMPSYFEFSVPVFACVLLAMSMVGGFLSLCYLDYRMNPPGDDPLELRTDLITEFLVVPPPEDLVEQLESGDNVEDPGARREEEAGGKAHEGPEGRVGREEATQEDTEVAGEVQEVVRSSPLIQALAETNAIADALEGPSIQDLLAGGTGSLSTIMGRGSGGTALRGTGTGGGGEGPGFLFASGNAGMGSGSGRGRGAGRGDGGFGAPGADRGEHRVSVRTGGGSTTGQCNAGAVNGVVRSHVSAIRYCYEVEVQRAPNLRGRVTLTWRISSAGAVSSARVGNSSLGNARVEGCMVRQVRRWRFPPPEQGECVVHYPFMFGVSGGG